MPEQTLPERELEKGREILRRRRAFGREVEAGEELLSEYVVGGPNCEIVDWLKNARLGLILRWLPGVGPATVEKILSHVPMTDWPASVPGPRANASTQLKDLSYR